MSEIQNNSKWSTNQEIVVEAGLIGICETTKYDDLEDIKLKLQVLEDKISSGVITTKEVKKVSKKPIIVKLSPNVTNIVEMAKAVEEAKKALEVGCKVISETDFMQMCHIVDVIVE